MTQEAVVTNGDDIIIVEYGSRGIYVNPSKGHDVLDFSDIFADIRCLKTERVEGTRDLKVYDKHAGYSNDYVIIKNYFTSDKANDTSSSVQTIRVHGQDYSLNEFIDYTGGYKIKKGKVEGTVFNDTIDYSDYEILNKYGELVENSAKKGLTINGGAGNDTITGTIYSDNIKVSSGSNYIDAFYGNNKITLGKGSDTVYHEFDYGYWNDTIYNSSNNDSLSLESCYLVDSSSPIYNSGYNPLDNIQFVRKGNDLALCYGFDGVSSDNTIVLKNYFKQSVQNRLDSVNYNEIYFDDEGYYVDEMTVNESLYEYLRTQRNIDSIYDIAKGTVMAFGCGKVTGLNDYNNYLCGSAGKDKIKGGNNINLTDYIDAGRGKDVITGGAGRTIMKYVEGDGKDTINISAGEQFILKYVASDDVSIDDYSFVESGKDLIVMREYQKEVKKKGKTKLVSCCDRLVFKNYKNADSITIDLYSEANGGIYGDIVETSSLFANGENGFIFNLGKEGSKKSSKLTGSYLNERIFGSSKADIIYTGGGFDVVNSGGGNDKIYLDSGIKSLKFANGSGQDTVYINSDDVSAAFVYDSNSDLTYTVSDDGKDLIITNTYTNKKGKIVSDSVTVKDFFDHEDFELFIQNDDGFKSVYRYLTGYEDYADMYTADELAMIQLGVDKWQDTDGVVFDISDQMYQDENDLQCYITD